jgi:hypothetical protein
VTDFDISLLSVHEKCASHKFGGFMKKRAQSFWFIGAVFLLFSLSMALAQQTTPQQSSHGDPQAQTPATPSQAEPNPTPSHTPDQAARPAPESQAESTQSAEVQSFTGTILKSGDRYVLQDGTTGNNYDLDHQDQLQKYENKKVRVHGTLDPSGKMIRLQ